MLNITPGVDQQFQHVVQHGRVAAGGANNRVQIGQAIRPERRSQGGLAGVHPVNIPLNSIDFAVVRHQAERLSALPVGGGIGAVTRVHGRQGRFVERVGQVQVKIGQVGGQHQPFVNKRMSR